MGNIIGWIIFGIVALFFVGLVIFRTSFWRSVKKIGKTMKVADINKANERSKVALETPLSNEYKLNNKLWTNFNQTFLGIDSTIQAVNNTYSFNHSEIHYLSFSIYNNQTYSNEQAIYCTDMNVNETILKQWLKQNVQVVFLVAKNKVNAYSLKPVITKKETINNLDLSQVETLFPNSEIKVLNSPYIYRITKTNQIINILDNINWISDELKNHESVLYYDKVNHMLYKYKNELTKLNDLSIYTKAKEQ